MKNFSDLIISRFTIKQILFIFFALIFSLSGAGLAVAASTSNFQQTINAGTLSVDITDSSYTPIGSPSVVMTAGTFSFICQTVTGTFGTTSEQVYIQNPDAADDGFTVSLAASDPTDLWDSGGTDFDFNDPTGSGCTDGGDADSFGGQMSIDASGATLSEAACSACDTTGSTLGTPAAFNQGTLDSITLLTAAAGSDDVGDWYIRNIAISQKIPAEQPAASDYNIDMTLSILAS